MVLAENEHKSGFITLIDFEKAFDSIEWPFLFKCLKNFNFGDYFISWIRILYTNIKSCVGNNGYYSDKFDVLRSVRQGCPISALLFILVAEILAINVRENDEIRGITYNNRSFQITQLADDTTLFLADLESVVISISLFQTFVSVSGLTLNLDKSEIIPLGENVHKNIKLPQELKKLRYNNGAFKTLGIWFTNKKREKISLNFDEKIKKIEIVLNVWSMRALSLKGKVTILKSLIISQMTLLFSVLFVPEYILQKLDKLIFSFLWDGKTPKVKRETMINNINDGGLGMPDVYLVNSTSKISWIKRLTNERDCKWKILTLYMLNLNSTHLSHKIPETWISHCKTDFHKQLLQCWLFFKNMKPVGDVEILNEYIFHSSSITTGNTVLSPQMFGLSNSSQNLSVKIMDLLNLTTGLILNINTINENLNWKLNFLQYMRLKSVISQIIVRLTRNLPFTDTDRLSEEPYIRIKFKQQLLSKIKTREIYQELVSRISKPPTLVSTWINIYPFLETHAWHITFALPYKIVHEPYLQSFQFKIIHRIINCNDNLYKWKIIDSPKCNFCTSIDTIEHHFYYCHTSIEFWRKLSHVIYEVFNLNIQFTVCEILLGLSTHNDFQIKCINFLVLCGKWFLNQKKGLKKTAVFNEYLTVIKSKLNVLCMIHNSENKMETFNKLYRDLLDYLQN